MELLVSYLESSCKRGVLAPRIRYRLSHCPEPPVEMQIMRLVLVRNFSLPFQLLCESTWRLLWWELVIA